jgi:hypothetical protein
MKADRVEVSRHEPAKEWLIRIHVGEEVIRRHIRDLKKDASEDTLRDAALKVTAEEGYTVSPSDIVFS